MIPKTIHYCWFGGKELPKLAKKCLRSWKKYCSDYEIKRWDESNIDITTCPLYVRQAYEEKKWAFVTDYIRLKIVFENGGIYLDTDVELKKSFNKFLKHHAFFGFENGDVVNTGSGFGAEKNSEFVKKIMNQYDGISFKKSDGTYDLTPCPTRNTEIFEQNGLIRNDKLQILDENVAIYPTEYFCPIHSQTKEKNITVNTHSIHWFSGSWMPLKVRMVQKIMLIMDSIIGKERAYKFRQKIKKIVNNKE